MKPPDGIELISEELALDRSASHRAPVAFRVERKDQSLTLAKAHGARGAWLPLVVGLVFPVGGGAFLYNALGPFGLLMGAPALVALAYFFTFHGLDRPRLTFDRDWLTRSHRPLPWFSKSWRRDKITYFAVQRDNSYRVNGVPVKQFQVMLHVEERSVVLWNGIRTRQQANYLVGELEAWLNRGDD